VLKEVEHPIEHPIYILNSKCYLSSI